MPKAKTPSGFIVMSMLVVISCASIAPTKNAHIVFLDYSASASTFSTENRPKIERLLTEIVRDFEPDDLLEVFPIHSFTASATAILKLRGPELKGDLRDKKRRKDWLQNHVSEKIKRMWDFSISGDRREYTNLYPIVRKISRIKSRGYEVTAYAISDMVQDNGNESFVKIFSPGSRVDPRLYAQDKVSELGFEGVLKGVDVIVKIPGSPQGNSRHNNIRYKVIEFWKEFFELCGADVVMEDL